MRLQGFTNIPAALPFLPTLAAALLAGRQAANALIFVPTRRAAVQLNQILAASGEFSAENQPRIIPLAAVPLTVEEQLPNSLLTTDLPPPIAPLTRTRILWQLLLQRADMVLSPPVAWQLAVALGNLLDECALHEIDPTAWQQLAPLDFAAHWGLTLDFLQIILHHWPRILAERAQSDPATYQHAALMALAAYWEALPPQYPVIAAGSTGSLPATANLLCRIAKLPHGVVVLPGFDAATAAHDVPLTHPQAMMQRLLARCHLPPQQVQYLGAEQARTKLWSQVLHPDQTMQEAPLDLPAALHNIHYIPCNDVWYEAQIIAFVVQQAIAQGAKRIGIITPDAKLGGRIQQALQRWQINALQSLGDSALDFAAIRFVLHCVALAATPDDPALLLACLQHPAWNYSPAQLSEWQALLRAQPFTHFRNFVQHYQISALYPIAEKFAAWQAAPPRPIDDWLAEIQLTLLTYCPNWVNQPGYTAWEALLVQWGEHTEPRLSFSEFVPWWVRWVGQARLPLTADDNTAMVVIWGLLEARLQNTDMVILASLNEGLWPAEPTPNPWLSRHMRQQLGLPPPEQSIGQMAHDFVQALHSAPQVYLTRPLQIEGVGQTPARWLQQLDIFLQRRNTSLAAINESVQWHTAVAALDQPVQEMMTARPAPNPPLPARPRVISATGIQQLRKNPYAYYAQRILNLSAQAPITHELSASAIGSLVHHTLAEYLAPQPLLTDNALRELLQLATRQYAHAFWRSQPGVQTLQRLEGLFQHALAYEMQARATGQILVAAEAQGRGMLRAGKRTITLTAQADRIDRLADGSLNIIDYKTGTPPSTADIERGYHVQLPLAAWLMEQGGFANVPPTPIGMISFWRLQTVKQETKPTSWGADKIEKWVVQLEEGLTKTLTQYLAEPNAFRPALRTSNYDDYAILARRGLW